MAKRALRVLVVDDEKLVCDAVKLLLEFDGHRVQAVGSGKEALSVLGDQEFDLVMTDYNMPEMKGDQLAATIKGLKPNLPVVMITAYPELVPPFVQCVVTKPFRLEDLRQVISQVC
jgi:CheY-like chemotaxis protein